MKTFPVLVTLGRVILTEVELERNFDS